MKDERWERLTLKSVSLGIVDRLANWSTVTGDRREVESRTARRAARNKYMKRIKNRESREAVQSTPQSLPNCEASTLTPDRTINVSDSSGQNFVMVQVEASYSRNSATKHTGVANLFDPPRAEGLVGTGVDVSMQGGNPVLHVTYTC